jgi:hypothetical protein
MLTSQNPRINLNRNGSNAHPDSIHLQSERLRLQPADVEPEIAQDPDDLAAGTDSSQLNLNDSTMQLIPGGRAGVGHDQLLTPEQVAARLNVSPDWVRDHSSRKTPRLPVIRLGGGPGRAGLLRYRASDIEKFIQQMALASELRARAV